MMQLRISVLECTLLDHMELLIYQHLLLRSKEPSLSPQGCSHSTQSNLCPAFICSWDCPDPGAGPCTWCYRNSGGWHSPTSQMDVTPFLQRGECTTQLIDVSQLAEGDPCATIHTADKDVQQQQSQNQPLGNFTHHWSPLGH